jgi:hypothetical protein
LAALIAATSAISGAGVLAVATLVRLAVARRRGALDG